MTLLKTARSATAARASRTRTAVAASLREPGPTLHRLFLGAWHVWAVVLVAGAIAAPRLTTLIPAVEDHVDEIYQPQRALKFAATAGQQFHKYGPVPNFVLLPFYAPTIGYWKLTGQFSRPQNDYPFGLSRPMEQLGVLIFEGRLVFLVLALLGMGLLTLALGKLTGSKIAAAGAMLLVVATDYRVQWQLPLPMPDSSMVAFLLMAAAAWVWTLARGVTPWRCALFAAAAALAAGSKENAMPLMLAVSFAILGVVWVEARRGETTHANARRSTFSLVGVGVGLYLLTSVVYAPGVWVRRMQYWTTGPGVDAAIWGESADWSQHVAYIGRAILDNLGPAGTPVAAVAVVAAFVWRPTTAAILAVPVAAALLVLLKVSYVVDRFATPGVVLAAPLVALGIAAVIVRPPVDGLRPRVRAIAWLLVPLVLVNVWWSLVVYNRVAVLPQSQIEADAATLAKDRVISVGTMIAEDGGLYRLRHLGHAVDLRPLQVAAAQGELPDVVYATRGQMQFIEEARDRPARAADLIAIKDFHIDQWPGYAKLGYRERRIEAQWPAWLAPFKWMPLRDEDYLNALLVYERDPAAPAKRPADAP